MIKLRFKKKEGLHPMQADSTYSKKFSLALLNWETNRQETRFAFNIFDANGRKSKKSASF